MLPLLYVIFILSVITQIIFFYIFSKFSFSQQQNATPQQPPISIIICAKNETDNLNKYLEKILTQSYSNFEVVVVNDGSVDGTSILLQNFKIRFPHLNIVEIDTTLQYLGNKKNAITKGVHAAKNEHLLFTDADCMPNSQHWISEMIAHFTDGKEIVLGYGAYQKINRSFLNKLIRYETLMTAIQYFSYAKTGTPYMGVGRNIAYKKELFIKANGLKSHTDIKSGDDDLFINQVANAQNTAICYSENGFTVSAPKTNFKHWINQKRRHITTAVYYKPIHKFLLSLYYFSQISFWLLTIILLAFSLFGRIEFWNVFTFIVMRLFIQYIIIGKAAQKLNEKDLIFWFPLLDISLVFIQFSIFIVNLNRKPNTW